MSRGKNLQEMDTGTKQSKTAVNAKAKAAEPMPKLTTGIPDGQSGSWEDLGGPTVDNYKPDNDSAKLKDPAAVLSQVRDIVNRGAKKADAMPKMAKGAVKESSEDDEDFEEYDEEGVEGYEDEDEEELEEASKSEKEDDDDEDEDEEDEEDEDEEESDSKKKDKMKAKMRAKMEEEVEAIEAQIEEDVDALLSGDEGLSEEFRFKAKTVFEAALNARTEQIEEAVLLQYEERLAEEVEEITEALTERVDAYLEYVADEWIQENAIAVDQGLRTQMTESFLENLKELFEDHYVTIPEERYDVLESMVEKLDDMETKLNEQIERNVALNKRLAESVTDVILSDVSEGLALSQKDKLASLAENVEFDGEEEYREKLVALRESYFPTTTQVTHRNTQDYLVEGTTDVTPYQPTGGTMDVYLNALERVSRK